jgi:PncC family amidohydrolase
VSAFGSDRLAELGREAGALLAERGETVAVAEGSAGGLVSAALLAVPGASNYYLGGVVAYTARANSTFLAGAVEAPEGMRGATEEFATYLAASAAARLGATWGIGEGGAAGPANRYGDPAGHAWVAVAGPAPSARHVLTGLDDRGENMVRFAEEALDLLVAMIRATGAS